MLNAALRIDFNATAGLYKDFIDQMKVSQPGKEINVAAFGTANEASRSEQSGGGGKDNAFDGIKPDMSIDDRYYNVTEYCALTPAQKHGLHLKHDGRDPSGDSGKRQGKKPGRGKPKTGGPTKKTQIHKASIKAIAKKVAFHLANEEGSEPEEMSDDEQVETPSPTKNKIVNNRTNSALRHK
jgi:hypothetical protein